MSNGCRGTFGRNNGLKSLTISHNKLRKLDPNTFKGMRMMRRLYMSDNNIAEVGRGTFESLSRIGTIDLARNSIKKIDFQMFNSLPFVEVMLKYSLYSVSVIFAYCNNRTEVKCKRRLASPNFALIIMKCSFHFNNPSSGLNGLNPSVKS